MDMVPKPLPLLHLPPRVQKRVLLSWDRAYVFILSLLSIKAMQLVRSLKLKSYESYLSIGTTIEMFFETVDYRLTLTFYKDNLHNPIMAAQTAPGQVHAEWYEFGPRLEIWTRPNYSMKDWINHFLSIFDLPKIGKLYFPDGRNRFDLESLKEVIGEIGELNVHNLFSDEVTLSIVRTFRNANGISLNRRFDLLREVWIQNFGKFTINRLPQHNGLLLNDLLICNGKQIRIHNTDFSIRDINRFLKLWKLGSNPRLQTLEFTTRGLPEEGIHEIPRGIETRPISEENERRLPVEEQEHMLTIETQMDLSRKDGKKASLVIKSIFEFRLIYLYVWD